MTTEHPNEPPAPRATVEAVAAAMGRLDNEEWHSPAERARRFLAHLSADGFQVQREGNGT